MRIFDNARRFSILNVILASDCRYLYCSRRRPKDLSSVSWSATALVSEQLSPDNFSRFLSLFSTVPDRDRMQFLATAYSNSFEHGGRSAKPSVELISKH